MEEKEIKTILEKHLSRMAKELSNGVRIEIIPTGAGLSIKKIKRQNL